MDKTVQGFFAKFRYFILGCFLFTILIIVICGAVAMCYKISTVPQEDVTREYHQLHPLLHTDGIKVKPWLGYITEGPVKLDDNLAMIRVQVDPRPEASYASEYGAVIALSEQPQIGDKVIMANHEVYNNAAMSRTFVRIAHKIK